MVWLHCSPIPVGRTGVISSFNWFLAAVSLRVKGGGVGTLWCQPTRLIQYSGQIRLGSNPVPLSFGWGIRRSIAIMTYELLAIRNVSKLLKLKLPFDAGGFASLTSAWKIYWRFYPIFRHIDSAEPTGGLIRTVFFIILFLEKEKGPRKGLNLARSLEDYSSKHNFFHDRQQLLLIVM